MRTAGYALAARQSLQQETAAAGTGSRRFRSVTMPKKPVRIEIVQEGDERFLVRRFADGSEERHPIVKLPRKPSRFPYRKVVFDKSRKKGF
jgi:hypothetical protein